jgi:hypothetical protein
LLTAEESHPADGNQKAVDSPVIRRAVTVVALVWLSLLCWMAATSANSVIVNVAAAVRCNAVVTAEVTAGKVVKIERLWRGREPDEPIALPVESIPGDGRYVLLLTRMNGNWSVARAYDTGQVLVYPATDAVERQFEKLPAER